MDVSLLTTCMNFFQDVLNVTQIIINIPWNPSTIFHPDRTAEISLKCLLSLGVLPVLQHHLCQIGEESKYNDATIDLNKLCHTPVNYLYKSVPFLMRCGFRPPVHAWEYT